MPSFVDLPSELILHIIAQDTIRPPGVFSLGTSRRKALLTSLCRTCRYFRDIVQPKLYETVEITEITRTCRHRSLRLLTQTITSRPDLGAKTKTLVLKLGGFSRETVRSQDTVVMPEPIEDLKARDALLSMLFSELPNLLTLELKDSDRSDYFWTQLFTPSHDEKKSGRVLPALRHLSIHPYNARTAPFNFSDITVCLAQPGLRSLSMKFAASLEQHPTWNPVILQPHSIYLTSLELISCHVPQCTLQLLLQACIDLKRFVYDCPHVNPMFGAIMGLAETDYSGFDDPRHVELIYSVISAELLLALNSCVDSLEELELAFDLHAHRNPLIPIPLSFSRFERLRRLRVQERLFSLLNRLPPALESLALSDYRFPSLNKTDWTNYQNIKSITQCFTLQQLSMTGEFSQMPFLKDLEQEASHCSYGTMRERGNLVQSHCPRSMTFHVDDLEIHLIHQTFRLFK